MTIHWKGVEQYFTVLLFVFRMLPSRFVTFENLSGVKGFTSNKGLTIFWKSVPVRQFRRYAEIYLSYRLSLIIKIRYNSSKSSCCCSSGAGHSHNWGNVFVVMVTVVVTVSIVVVGVSCGGSGYQLWW